MLYFNRNVKNVNYALGVLIFLTIKLETASDKKCIYIIQILFHLWSRGL